MHFQHIHIFIPHFSEKPLSRAIINRRSKKLKDGASDTQSNPLQRRMGLEVVDELVERGAPTSETIFIAAALLLLLVANLNKGF